ncbi:DUF1350 family protein [Prochlorococcus sp. MIT 1307]|uniref:DUF1350 family protein n=1 Tax=Prochlorococcus sp. MIT 1307 TaxID=3096219 RepID=UPI002A75D4CC|nr:DUF1350 family protein [Prochlorococcus sp. MIT 1307]
MSNWRLIKNVWCNWPTFPSHLIEMIGGSYLGASPHISYRKILNKLASQNIAVHAWSYIPGFDHQCIANNAWRDFRYCRKKLEHRISAKPITIRLGHSLGSKLHLLAPDGGRNSNGFISMSFNNYNAYKSIPILKELAPKFNINKEFSPSPKQTLRIISENFYQPNNLIISFIDDQLDQSSLLLQVLKSRVNDSSEIKLLKGDHLTPTSTGISKKLLGESAINKHRTKNLESLINTISAWL